MDAKSGLEKRPAVEPGYTAAELGRAIGIPARRIRNWARDGLIGSLLAVGGRRFDYRQAATAKTFARMAQKGIAVRTIRAALDRLGRWRAAGAAQASLVLADAPRRLLVRLPDGRLAEPNGQLQFPFVDGRPAAERRVVSFCDAGAWRRFGEELARMDRWNEAASAFREALRLGRDDTDLNFQLAYALQQAGRDSEAVDAYRSVLRLNPADGEAWNNLGVALLSLGHTHEAARSFRRAVTLLPGCADARENLERVLKR